MSLLAPAFTYQRRPMVDAQGNPLPSDDPTTEFPQGMTTTGADTPMAADTPPPPPVAMPPEATPSVSPATITPSPLPDVPAVPVAAKVPPSVQTKPTASQRWFGHSNATPPPVSVAANGAQQMPNAPAPRTPGILQRIAAAGLGAATGYVNAARRTQIDPDTIARGEQGILHPGYGAQMGAYNRTVQQIQGQADLNSKAAKEKAELENAASWTEQREATAEDRKAKAASYATNTKEKADAATAARVDRLWKLQTADRSVSAAALPGWQPAQNPDGATVYLSPATKKAPKELLEWLPGVTEGQEIPSREFDVAADAYRASLKTTKAQDNKGDPAAQENDKQWIADSINPDPAISGPAKKKLAALTQQTMATRPVINNMIPGLSGQTGPSAKLTGDEYLASLPPATAAQIKGIAEGRATMPSASTRSQAAQDLRQAVFQYDPSFSDQRAQVRKSFTTGPDGRNIGALNTASVHLDQLSDAATALKNGAFQPGNQAYNYLSRTFGKQAVSNFASLKNAVAGELAQALKGQATDVEIANIARAISDAQSPEQLAGAVETNLHILGAKLRTYQERYQQQIPGDSVWSPLMPSARSVFAKHGFDPTGDATDKMVLVKMKDGRAGQIHASQLQNFLRDNPGSQQVK